MNTGLLIPQVSPPLDRSLATALLTEFIDLERRFLLGDWEPATLDGGQLAEVASRIIYHIDSGNLSPKKGLDRCLGYVEDANNSNKHLFPDRPSARHLCRVLRLIYKFRSQRGAVHIDPNHTANELDATLVLSLSRWVVSEMLRTFWSGDRSEVARTIRAIVRYPVPSVFAIDGQSLVMWTDGTAEEEILLLLHNVGEAGLSRAEIGKAAMKSASAVTKAIGILSSPTKRQVVRRSDGQYSLTPNGTRRVNEEISAKLHSGVSDHN